MTNLSDTLAALKPCPFCGGEACCTSSAESGEPEIEDCEPLAWGVGCSCTAFVGPWSTEAEAIAAWNTRTGQLVPVPSVEKVADVLFATAKSCAGWDWKDLATAVIAAMKNDDFQ